MNTEAEVDGQCNVDLREKGLSRDEMQKRAAWRQHVRNIDPSCRSCKRSGGRRHVLVK